MWLRGRQVIRVGTAKKPTAQSGRGNGVTSRTRFWNEPAMKVERFGKQMLW